MFHFSDSHVSLETESWRQERVSLGLEPEDPMHEGHETERALRNFEQQVALAVERKADLIVNTGDLLNLPSEETIAWVKNIIERAGIPFRFISGNHDWCFEGLGKPPRYASGLHSSEGASNNVADRGRPPVHAVGSGPASCAGRVAREAPPPAPGTV